MENSHVGLHWTDNNSESINHMCVMPTNWTAETVPGLTNIIYDVVQGLYMNADLSFVFTGND